MKLIADMKLYELVQRTSLDSEKMQDKVMRKFGLGEHDAEDVLSFVDGGSDWESLSDEVREKMYSHYQKSPIYGTSKDKIADPMKFILPALKKDLGI